MDLVFGDQSNRKVESTDDKYENMLKLPNLSEKQRAMCDRGLLYLTFVIAPLNCLDSARAQRRRPHNICVCVCVCVLVCVCVCV